MKRLHIRVSAAKLYRVDAIAVIEVDILPPTHAEYFSRPLVKTAAPKAIPIFTAGKAADGVDAEPVATGQSSALSRARAASTAKGMAARLEGRGRTNEMHR